MTNKGIVCVCVCYEKVLDFNLFMYFNPSVITVFSFFCVVLGFELRALHLLGRTSSPFCSGYFGDGGSPELFASNLDPQISVSQVARILTSTLPIALFDALFHLWLVGAFSSCHLCYFVF
jgi:hypothetical protein